MAQETQTGLCINLEGWDVEGNGREGQKGGDICTPMDCKEIHSEGDQPWDFFGRNDAKAEAPVLWLPYVKS